MGIGPSQYKVTFTYVEPQYARHRGLAERNYCGSFTVKARTPEEAIRKAGAEFTNAQLQSSVSWVREIRSVECQLLEH